MYRTEVVVLFRDFTWARHRARIAADDVKAAKAEAERRVRKLLRKSSNENHLPANVAHVICVNVEKRVEEKNHISSTYGLPVIRSTCPDCMDDGVDVRFLKDAWGQRVECRCTNPACRRVWTENERPTPPSASDGHLPIMS